MTGVGWHRSAVRFLHAPHLVHEWPGHRIGGEWRALFYETWVPWQWVLIISQAVIHINVSGLSQNNQRLSCFWTGMRANLDFPCQCIFPCKFQSLMFTHTLKYEFFFLVISFYLKIPFTLLNISVTRFFFFLKTH